MPGLFISYRRDDQAGFTGRLADSLEAAFGAENVFRDIEDIRPGEDFVVALQQQLQSVDVMLVVIGPAWLTASKNSVRRLDDPEDFVRREIQAGLESGKPLLPVLVSGASMPEEKDLPAAIGALARRQACVLSDLDWSADVARLVDSIRPFLPVRRRVFLHPALSWGLAGVVLIALLAAGLKAYWPGSSTHQPTPVNAEMVDNFAGRWTAQVRYDWGDAYEETFELKLENGEVHGTASYLRRPLAVEQGQRRADRLSFITHSQEMLGDATREVTHRYRGQLKGSELDFVLESSGGHSLHTPVAFVARQTSR